MDIKYYDRLLNVVGGGEVIEYIELLERARARKFKMDLIYHAISVIVRTAVYHKVLNDIIGR